MLIGGSINIAAKEADEFPRRTIELCSVGMTNFLFLAKLFTNAVCRGYSMSPHF
jgi:hypothetical protein